MPRQMSLFHPKGGHSFTVIGFIVEYSDSIGSFDSVFGADNTGNDLELFLEQQNSFENEWMKWMNSEMFLEVVYVER